MDRDQALQVLDDTVNALADGGWVLRNRGFALCLEPMDSALAGQNEIVAPGQVPASPRGSVCPTCGSSNLKLTGTCESCLDCGESVGGCG